MVQRLKGLFKLLGTNAACALLRANTQQKPPISPELLELRWCDHDQCWCVEYRDTSLAAEQSWLSV